ncbi:unnamed protein product [Somion occarium]|uniref:Uncharacterized protein n=1 Tax=Somion occarium TaxID=3059160 RepID=A0ABP1E2L3_9APHY
MVEGKRVRVTEGLHRVRKLDVVIPSSTDLEDKLKNLTTSYHSQKTALVDFVEFASSFIRKYSVSSSLLALGKPAHDSDDVWCIDTRGLLTLAVGKETYEQLGLVGKHLPWKPWEDTHVIRIFLSGDVPKTHEVKIHSWSPYGSKQKAALKVWDQRRGPWDAIYTSTQPEFAPPDVEGPKKHTAIPSIRHLTDVKIPSFDLQSLHQRQNHGVDLDDRQDKITAYFEWVGMACLGSERLRSGDNVDPYLAVYDPPLSLQVGNLTHLRWSGLLPPEFVQKILDVIVHSPFAAFAAHSVPTSPVAYISPPPQSQSSVRAPRAESEDTWSILLRSDGADGTNGVRWILAETIGQWDARWG